jgi:hypothetical protein
MGEKNSCSPFPREGYFITLEPKQMERKSIKTY